MARRLGPRFGLEVGFLFGVAVVLGLLEVAWPTIVVAMAVSWLLVAGAEIAAARLGGPPPEPAEREPAAPREWNLRELERIAREREGADPGRDQERSYLLLSLRDFARPDGNLPVELDPLVRDAFGELLHTTA